MIDLSRWQTARRRFSERYRGDFTKGMARKGNRLADELGDRMPVDTGSLKDSWHASTPASQAFAYDPRTHFNPTGDPAGLRIPEVPFAVPWGAPVHVSVNSEYVPFVRSAQVGFRPIREVTQLVVDAFVFQVIE